MTDPIRHAGAPIDLGMSGNRNLYIISSYCCICINNIKRKVYITMRIVLVRNQGKSALILLTK